MGFVMDDAPPLRTLVSDDDPLVRRLIRDTLQRENVTVIAEARTGREAVELALFYRPDVVVTDYMMPEMDGIEATRRIYEQAPEIRVILLTGSSDETLGMRGGDLAQARHAAHPALALRPARRRRPAASPQPPDRPRVGGPGSADRRCLDRRHRACSCSRTRPSGPTARTSTACSACARGRMPSRPPPACERSSSGYRPSPVEES